MLMIANKGGLGVFAAATFAVIASTAVAADLTVFVPNNLRGGMSLALQAFEKSSGHKVVAKFGGSRAFVKMIQKDAQADVVILGHGAIARLKKSGKIALSPTPNIAKVGIGVAVRKGASKPNISNLDKLKAAVISAKTVGYSDPKVGFLGGHLERSFQKLGLMPNLKQKKRTFPPGGKLWKAVESGQVELGFGPASAILGRPGLELVGQVPAEIQHFNQFTAGIPKSSKNTKAAIELINFLQSSTGAVLLQSRGLVPG